MDETEVIRGCLKGDNPRHLSASVAWRGPVQGSRWRTQMREEIRVRIRGLRQNIEEIDRQKMRLDSKRSELQGGVEQLEWVLSKTSVNDFLATLLTPPPNNMERIGISLGTRNPKRKLF